MYQLLIIIIVFLIGYQYYLKQLKQLKTESFTCYPDIYDAQYDNIKTNHIKIHEVKKLIARKPKYINKTIIKMNKDTANTIYLSAYSKENQLVGYLKMAVTEKFIGDLIEVGFYEQELFGFTGAFGYHIYELVGLDQQIIEKLVKRAIHQLKEDGNRYYLSVLCLTQSLAKVLMDKFKFILTLKEQSRRFYPNNLYTLVYYK